MFRTIKQGVKKLIPGQSENGPANNSSANSNNPATPANEDQAQTSLPDSYLDTDSLFK